jgi:serine/threonine protein kinase
VSFDLRRQLQDSLGHAYAIERELGGGGMSRVFLAEKVALGRRVVVKALAPELSEGLSAERFSREIRLAAALQQANIVPLLSTGSAGGLPYYTMPYVDGQSLRSRLDAEGRLSVAETVSVLRDVARALAHAHVRGVVHRDIKPENTLLSGGTAVVTDFGIAKAVEDARTLGSGELAVLAGAPSALRSTERRTALTALGATVGTPAYMAPEQAAGDVVDARTDVYALGCVAYEMLTGASPFAGRAPLVTLGAQVSETPVPLRERRPDVPSALASLVLQPDVVYEIGKPGSSALDCVTSAVKKVIEMGYADPKHIGLQGHSWGGYQSSFIVTQTDLFAAVVTGAPPTNLVSFYDELYKSTGTVQQGIMELGQVRMGVNVTPWNAHELYESQSPVHHVTNIKTPFLILQGTADGAVDWVQGLEFFNAARRNGKEVIFLSYPDEPHHLAKKENQKDFQIRMKQFFDHYLMDKPAPKWMTDGVPQVKKGGPIE